MIYLLTATGLPPGGSCIIHIYTQTIHRTTHNKQYISMQSNAQVAEYHSPLCSYASNKIPSKDMLLQFGNAACKIYRSDIQQLKITAQYRMTEFIHSGKLPSSVQLVSAVAISLPFMGDEDLEDAGFM